MVALFVVFFILVMLSVDFITHKNVAIKERMIADANRKDLILSQLTPELGITMADGGELIEEEVKKLKE